MCRNCDEFTGLFLLLPRRSLLQESSWSSFASNLPKSTQHSSSSAIYRHKPGTQDQKQLAVLHGRKHVYASLHVAAPSRGGRTTAAIALFAPDIGGGRTTAAPPFLPRKTKKDAKGHHVLLFQLAQAESHHPLFLIAGLPCPPPPRPPPVAGR